MAEPFPRLSRSSIYVAPLQISKSNGCEADHFTQNDAREPRRQSTRTLSAHSHAEMTPPPTPHGSSEALVQPPTLPHPVFHSFLRAFYPFHPDTATLQSSTVTLQLTEGDVILVHSIHTNGWADGTLLKSGARGWLPTNYCEAYDHSPIRNLLKALLNLWDLLCGDLNTTMDCFENQEFMRGVIAGVRCLLERTDCLTRESALIRSHDGLRRHRKALLADLSTLVKSARALQSRVDDIQTVEEVEDNINEITLKAFKIVTRGVAFLDIWYADLDSRAMAIDVPPTPPADTASFGQAISTDPPHLPTTSCWPTNQMMPGGGVDVVQGSDTHIHPSGTQTSDMSFTAPSSYPLPPSPTATSNSTPFASRPPSVQAPPHRLSASHRVSYNGPAAPRKNALVSQRLSVTHDAFLSHQGSFIGRLHLQSRSLSELLTTTQQSVTACRDLLAVVEAVWDRDLQRSTALGQAKDTMYSRITVLVQATRDIFRSTSSTDGGEDIVMPEDDGELMNAATGCVKAAGDCVAQTKFVIERIGDFEFEPIGLGIFDESRGDRETLGEDHSRPATPEEMASQFPPPPTSGSTSPSKSLPPSISSAAPSRSDPLTAPASQTSRTTPLLRSEHTTVANEEAMGLDEAVEKCRTESSSTYGSGGGWDYGFGTASVPSISTHSERHSGIPNSVVSAGVRSSSEATTAARDSADSSPVADRTLTPSHAMGSQTTLSTDCDDMEAAVLEKTFAHELVYNKDGQIVGGTLPALIERLTTHDSTPDSTFVSTFYLTFRLFTTPIGFAEALVERFCYVTDSQHVAGPVRLRVYNVFKGWLESHWRGEHDREALKVIQRFATGPLVQHIPAAGKRLAELCEKVSAGGGTLVPRLVSSIGKTNTSIGQYVAPDTPQPTPVITKSQLTSLRNWKHGGAELSILDFDALELARQFTIKESRIFCSIMPEELLAMEWTKKAGSKAVNVRAMSKLSTDLATVVADTILLEDPKKRAAVIKHWVKIAKKSLELNNYDSLMAIICSLNSSHILRLKKTWEMVSAKTKATLEEMRVIVEVSRNYAVLRQRLQGHVPPCLPFVGTYLTDLTFVDAGNQASRQLSGDGEQDVRSVINFDKHMKTAKIIGELQRFQIPYRLTSVPELQDWIDTQIQRVQSSDQTNIQSYYRRSLLLEPREPCPTQKALPPEPTAAPPQAPSSGLKGNFDFLAWTHLTKEKPVAISHG
ncbi:MAG: hypothetical protein M1838_004411 [Thelocarpon superellum]|nr:MAG: hypothetical protein M1838_004411 [Thelocarpon superellum]